jgi:hypothetical protein
MAVDTAVAREQNRTNEPNAAIMAVETREIWGRNRAIEATRDESRLRTATNEPRAPRSTGARPIISTEIAQTNPMAIYVILADCPVVDRSARRNMRNDQTKPMSIWIRFADRQIVVPDGGSITKNDQTKPTAIWLN